jgi:hypothetical protein
MNGCVTGVEALKCRDHLIGFAEDVIGRIGNPTNVAGFLRASQIPKLRRRITEKTPKPRKACVSDTVRIQSEQDAPRSVVRSVMFVVNTAVAGAPVSAIRTSVLNRHCRYAERVCLLVAGGAR